MTADERVLIAAKRLNKNADFETVLEHLVQGQAEVILAMEALSPNLPHAKIYYDALSDVSGLVADLAREAENG